MVEPFTLNNQVKVSVLAYTTIEAACLIPYFIVAYEMLYLSTNHDFSLDIWFHVLVRLFLQKLFMDLKYTFHLIRPTS